MEVNTYGDLLEYKKKSDQELKEVINEFLSEHRTPDHSFGKNQMVMISLLTTLVKNKTNEIRDQLIEIRTQMDIPRSNMIMQTKQKLTNLIKELQ